MGTRDNPIITPKQLASKSFILKLRYGISSCIDSKRAAKNKPGNKITNQLINVLVCSFVRITDFRNIPNPNKTTIGI